MGPALALSSDSDGSALANWMIQPASTRASAKWPGVERTWQVETCRPARAESSPQMENQQLSTP